MKVLWLCNIMLPAVAEQLGKRINHKEGWLSGIYEKLLLSDFRMENGEKLELGVCYPVSEKKDAGVVRLENLTAYGFYEDTTHPERYDTGLEKELLRIVREFEPDVVHCFGTEYPHTLAMVRSFPYPEKIVIGIQGLCYLCAKVYMAYLPEEVQSSVTLRDFLKQDSILKQYQKFVKRGSFETEALSLARHVTGRTQWDKTEVAKVSKAEYHFMNETLRKPFYTGEWQQENCQKHSIFLSQGDYPIKGLHFVLNAMPEILKKYPDTMVYVAGNDLTKTESFKDKIKISGYGRYLKKLITDYHLTDKVVFLGRLDAGQMKERYLNSNLYLCASMIENSPNSLGEAMLLGVPCLAADTGGIPSVFTDEKDGLLFECGNSMDLAQKVIYLFSNPHRQREFSKNAKEHAQKTHNRDENYRRLLEIYCEIDRENV